MPFRETKTLFKISFWANGQKEIPSKQPKTKINANRLANEAHFFKEILLIEYELDIKPATNKIPRKKKTIKPPARILRDKPAPTAHKSTYL